MDELQEFISAHNWSAAYAVASTHGIPSSYVDKHHFLASSTPTVLASLAQEDPEWTSLAVLACKPFDEDPIAQAQLISAGLSATELWIAQQPPRLEELLKEQAKRDGKERQGALDELRDLVKQNERIREVCEARWAMLERARRWEAYCMVYRLPPQPLLEDRGEPGSAPILAEDPWDDPDGGIEGAGAWGPLDVEPPPFSGPSQSLPPDAIPFSRFCSADPTALAMDLASRLEPGRVRALIRFYAIDSLEVARSFPLHADPAHPVYGPDLASLFPPGEPNESDPAPDILRLALGNGDAESSGPPHAATSSEVTQWYIHRVEAIDEHLGALDLCTRVLHHALARQVPGLDLLAEELSLFSRLVYTASNPDSQSWTLKKWRSESVDSILRAYLASASPTNLAREIRRLAFPYLSAMEASCERAGNPDPELTSRSLRRWALCAPLPLFAAFVKASSPSLRSVDRLLRDHVALTRMVLAGLYTSQDVESWPEMSAIFECMPSFQGAEPASGGFDARAVIRSALETASDAEGVYDVLMGLSQGELGALMDLLDDDIAAAEVLARWNVPLTLRELACKVGGNRAEQVKLATKMARQDEGQRVESGDEWMALLEAMQDLAGQAKVFELLGKEEVTRLFFSGLLVSGKIRLAKALFNPSNGKRPLDAAVQEELVLATSREFYDNAESGNMNFGDMKLAWECLSAAPQTPTIKCERDFIEATSRLASFKLYSQPGVLMSPIQIRLTSDKVTLIGKLLASNDDAYRHPDMVIELVTKLLPPSDRRLATVRTLALLADAALAKEDVARATETCERMIAAVEALRKAKGAPGASARAGQQAADIAWRTCAQLGRASTGGKELRMRLLGHAAVLCPPGDIGGLLASWRAVEAEQVPTDAVPLRTQAVPPLVIPSLSTGSGLQPALSALRAGGAPGTSGSPISRSHSPLTGVGVASGSAARAFGRAAALFGGGGGRGRAGSAGSPTPPSSASQHGAVAALGPTPPSAGGQDGQGAAERRTPAAIFDAVGEESAADRLTTALSHRFTSGVGWLIGADDGEL